MFNDEYERERIYDRILTIRDNVAIIKKTQDELVKTVEYHNQYLDKIWSKLEVIEANMTENKE